MWSIGLDVHERQSSICVLDECGNVVEETKIRGGWSVLLDRLRKIRHDFAICFEASCSYGFLHDKLRAIAKRVVVAHPGQLRLIFRSKRKNDRVDARKLAKLLFLDEVPVVHVPTVDVRAWRRLVEYRQRLVCKRTRCKNGLRALLRSHGIVSPRNLWSGKGHQWLREIAWDCLEDALQRDLLLDELEQLDGQVRRVEQHLNAIATRHPGVVLLRTIPGVGPRTAEAVVAYIDHPDRFRRTKQIGAYFGLVPCQDSSAAVNRLGHITREGPSSVRRLITEAAWQATRLDPTVRGYFERIAQGNRDRRKIALVATAHYLLRVMLAMLRTGETWRAAA